MNLQYMTLNALNNYYKIIASTIILLLITPASISASSAPLMKELTKVSPAVKAPELKLENEDEDIINIKDYLGKVVIINFWATWCPPCRREMNSLNELYLEMKNKDVVVLTINVGEDDDAVFEFMNNVSPALSFPVLFDKDSKAMERWGAIGLPTTYVIDKKGNIVYQAIGGRDFKSESIINALLELSKENIEMKK